MKALLQPTLVRRVVGALLLGFGLVWSALMLQGYLQFKATMAQESGVLMFARSMSPVLEQVDDAGRAAERMAAYDALFNRLRKEGGKLPGELLFQLYDAQGRRVYPAAVAEGMALAGTPGRMVEATLGHAGYWVARQDAARWSLRLGEPQVGDATVLGWMSRDLLPSLLVAFPIVALVLWVAVRRGLRPLRQLAEHVAARGHHDLSSLGLEPKYAELRPLAGALEDLLAQLRRKVQRERAFVQDAAHELRTPMAVIATQAHVVARAQGQSERAQAGRALEQAIARASHLSGQLLALASLDDGGRPAAATLDVARLAGDLMAQVAPAAMARRIELSLEGPDRLEVALDAAALQSVLQNLLDNALRYVHEGARVVVRLAAKDGGVQLVVADDGPGIAPVERERVFERFQRGAGHDAPGSGLGLAIVRQAVLRMGGTVAVHDGIDGRGVAFEVVLPAGLWHP